MAARGSSPQPGGRPRSGSADGKEGEEEKKPTVWHHQQMVILKEWGEKASGYRWMHERAAARYKKMHMNFSLPVIILSTLAGTANFAQSSFTGVLAVWGPQIIGGVNLVAGMITTIAQFLKIGELMEGHRVASIGFGKFSRSIAVELALPSNDRSMDGDEFLDKMRMEFDALLEASPPIPTDLGQLYLKTIRGIETANPTAPKISLPEILEVRGLVLYEPTKEEKAAAITAHAAGKLMEKGLMSKLKKTASKMQTSLTPKPPEAGGTSSGAAQKSAVELELANLRNTGAVKAAKKGSKQAPEGIATKLEEIMASQPVPEALETQGRQSRLASMIEVDPTLQIKPPAPPALGESQYRRPPADIEQPDSDEESSGDEATTITAPAAGGSGAAPEKQPESGV